MLQTTKTDEAIIGTFHVTSYGQGVDMKVRAKRSDRMDKKGKDNGKNQYVCGSMHLYRDCFYQNMSRRPAG
jgi:hypothetical protein